MEYLLKTHLNAWQYIVLLFLLLGFSLGIAAYVAALTHTIRLRTKEEKKERLNSFYVLWNPFLLIDDTNKFLLICSEIFLTLITLSAFVYKYSWVIERALSPFNMAHTFNFSFIPTLVYMLAYALMVCGGITIFLRMLFPTIIISIILIAKFYTLFVSFIFWVFLAAWLVSRFNKSKKGQPKL